MDVRDFDFDLPPDLIAQEPPAERGGARLLHLDRESGAIAHTSVSALPDLLRPGDLIVVNNTRVFPARLLGRRVPSGGGVECLLIRHLESGSDQGQIRARPGSDPDLVFPRDISARVRPGSGPGSGSGFWEALVHPGQKLNPGAMVV